MFVCLYIFDAIYVYVVMIMMASCLPEKTEKADNKVNDVCCLVLIVWKVHVSCFFSSKSLPLLSVSVSLIQSYSIFEI